MGVTERVRATIGFPGLPDAQPAGRDVYQFESAGFMQPPTSVETLRHIADTISGDGAFTMQGILRKAADELERATSERKPVAYMAFGTYEGEWIALPEYTSNSELGVKGKVMGIAHKEGYRGKADDRLAELGWVIRPVFDLDDASRSEG
jgi:hypothetical protein